MEIRGQLGILILSFTMCVPGIGTKQEAHLLTETSHQPIKLFKCFMSQWFHFFSKVASHAGQFCLKCARQFRIVLIPWSDPLPCTIWGVRTEVCTTTVSFNDILTEVIIFENYKGIWSIWRIRKKYLTYCQINRGS